MKKTREEYIRLLLLSAENPAKELDQYIDAELSAIRKVYFILFGAVCIFCAAITIHSQEQYDKDVVRKATLISDSLNQCIINNIDTISSEGYDPATIITHE